MSGLAEHLFVYRKALHKAASLALFSLLAIQMSQAEKKLRKKMNAQGVHVLAENPAIIAELASTLHPEADVRMSFAGAVRKRGNINYHLERFLDSLLAHVKDAGRVEVLVAIDKDDDIEHYIMLKRKYGAALRLRILISLVRYGYSGMHYYDKDLIPLLASPTRMMCDYSDDGYITLKDFDEKLLEIDALYPDNIYFIHTRLTNREEFIGDASKEWIRLFWLFQVQGSHCYFPVISKGVLTCAEDALQYLPKEKRRDWSPFANAPITDCFTDIIATFVRALGVNRIHELAMMEMNPAHAHHFNKRDQYGLIENDRQKIVLFSAETQAHLHKIAEVIAGATSPVGK